MYKRFFSETGLGQYTLLYGKKFSDLLDEQSRSLKFDMDEKLTLLEKMVPLIIFL